PSAIPPAMVVPVTITWRRDISEFVLVMALHLAGGTMNGAPDADIGPAAANVGDGVDVFVAGIGLLFQKRHRGQDLAGLAVTALRHVFRDPGRLHRMRLAIDGEALDGGDRFSLGGRDRQGA